MQMYIGIDPGKQGGLALLAQTEDGCLVLVSAVAMPLYVRLRKPTVCAKGVHAWHKKAMFVASRNWPGKDFVTEVCIENVHAMPRQGVSSSFQFGRMFGGAEVAAQSLGETLRHVAPSRWKRDFNLSFRKQEAMQMATEVFQSNEFWRLKKHEGIAEAALIALWAARHPKG